jgi:iron(II)-dependent oxidoreductase
MQIKYFKGRIELVFALFLMMGLWGCFSQKTSLYFSSGSPPGMVLIPEGYFWMGSAEEDGVVGIDVGVDEVPKHRVFLSSFYMDRYEVTNREYQRFVIETNRGNKVPGYWQNGTYPPGSGDEPVSDTDWFDANAYCAWLEKRLPTEMEWEKASRGKAGKPWPWGDQFQERMANTAEEGHEWKRPVGSYPEDKSPFGVYDIVGNVREWTSSWYDAYPGSTLKRVAFGKSFRVLKGGSYADGGNRTRLTHRNAVMPTHDPEGDRTWHTDYANGFRCAKDFQK